MGKPYKAIDGITNISSFIILTRWAINYFNKISCALNHLRRYSMLLSKFAIMVFGNTKSFNYSFIMVKW